MATSEFLDTHQYAEREIRKYELIYGRNFVSPGGESTATELIARLGLTQGMRVLDIGCGIGGSAFIMAGRYGAVVQGIDLSRNMIALARRRCVEAGLEHRVSFHHGDCLALSNDAEFDVAYSRDAFLHIHDKRRLLQVVVRALKPGGLLFFTDYCRGDGVCSAEFGRYVAERGYCLHTIAEYRALLSAAGLRAEWAEDHTAEFIAIHQRELDALSDAELGDDESQTLREGWSAKLERAGRGEQLWGVFLATKPATAVPRAE